MIKLNRLILLILLFFINTHSKAQVNKSYFNWTSHPNCIITLDSLIKNCSKYGLIATDYNRKILSPYLHINPLIQSVNTKTDSLIQLTALHFFSDLAYGNRIPLFGYKRLNYKFDFNGVNILLQHYANTNTLIKLVAKFNNASIEIITLLKEINKMGTPLTNKKRKILIQALNDYRWLNEVIKNNKLILVNIPSTHLTYYENGKSTLDMKVIVGKHLTPTVSLFSKLNQIVVNPYWNVPRSIMVREMLPHLKSDPGYIDRNHLQLLDLNYKTLNPYKINWENIDTVKFPYYIRQSTGCDNSLGVVKLDFDNPFGIYIHDTPEKSLFALQSRFYSHGCIRMEKPVAMAKLLLKNNMQALDSIDFENCYKNPSPINIQITEIVNVVIWYNLIDFDQQGNIRYYSDIYNKYNY